MQKFDADGNFVLTFGGEVNKTTNGNICTAASGNECGVGVEGSAPGFFSRAPGAGSYMAVGPGDQIYVGDKERVQVFEADGTYVRSIAIPGETVQSLAVDAVGDLYLAYFGTVSPFFESKPNVRKLSGTGTPICTMDVANPRGVTVVGDETYVISRPTQQAGVMQFSSSSCAKVDLGIPPPGFGFGELTTPLSVTPTGIATSPPGTCGLKGTDVIVANSSFANSFVNIYGPAPDISVCPPPVVPPDINDQYATTVNTSGATVKADINPNFWNDTTYYVEYGTSPCSGGGCTQVKPAPPGALLTKEVVKRDVTSSGVFLNGLTPDTTYFFRFVAESTGGGPVTGAEASFHTFPTPPTPKADCPNQLFRAELSAPLIDCRAYEMVSPVDKNNGDISVGAASVAMGSGDGARATFSSYRGFGEPEGAPYSVQYLAERGSGGWATRPISARREAISLYPVGSPGATTLFKAFSPDLCSAWMVQDNKIALSEPPPPSTDVANLYRRHNCPGPAQDSYTLLSPIAPPGFAYEPTESQYFIEPQGSSADGTRTVFRADAGFPGTNPPACGAKGIFQVYEMIEETGPVLVSVLPSGNAACTHSSAGTAQNLLEGELRESSLQNAVSADGKRVFWTNTAGSLPAPDGGKGDQPGQIYLRVNVGGPPITGEGCLGTEVACTLKVSGLASASPARFAGADPEGKRAIFSIDPDASGPLDESLYRFEAEPTPSVEEIAGEVTGVAAVSEDATVTYFVSKEDLTAGQANSEGDEAQAGQRNLYREQEGDFTFVGKLNAIDSNSTFGSPTINNVYPDRRTSRISPDGSHLAFMSTAQLTGFENTDVDSGEADAEVFLYDAAEGAAGTLRCVSCNPSGVRPAGRNVGTGGDPLFAAATIPGWTEQLRPTRILSADGNRLFFQSFEALVTRDTNGMQDVYEWERSSSESQCLKALGGELYVPGSGGCIGLISSGKSPQDSFLLDASAGGADVFFATRASLLPQDRDLVDVYDAREGGGYPPPPPPPVPCEGAGCQDQVPPPPPPTPSSSEFQGPGDLKPAKSCPKGKHKAKRKGKVVCVKNKKKGGKGKKGKGKAGKSRGAKR